MEFFKIYNFEYIKPFLQTSGGQAPVSPALYCLMLGEWIIDVTAPRDPVISFVDKDTIEKSKV